MKYPFITQRLLDAHKSPEALEALCALLERQPLACDEVWFSTDYGFPPLDGHKDSAQKMAVAAERIRTLGIVTSLQISNTLGHGEYVSYLDCRGLQWRRMMGADGIETPTSSCPRCTEFLDYISESTKAYCAWKPESVWIDDDLRMHYHGRVAYACFCPCCIAAFNAETGAAWTRETLVKTINTGDGGAVRPQWIEFGRQSLANIATVVAEAVHAVAPKCRLGLQHADLRWGAYNGPNYTPIFEALSRVTGQPVGSRPGGGFYDDHSPRGAFYKAFFSGHQNSRLPACVDDVRIEIENFPGSFSGKSAHGTAVEGTLALAYGSNALTLTSLMFPHEETAWHEHGLSTLAAWRPFWLRYLEASEKSRPAGVTVALGESYIYRTLNPGEGDFAWTNVSIDEITGLAPLGLPLTWDNANATLPILHANATDGLTDDEIRALMAKNVITDGEAILRLQKRGLADALPVTAESIPIRVRHERFTDDPLNGANAHGIMGLLSINPANLAMLATAIYPKNDGDGDVAATVRILAHYEDTEFRQLAPATVACTTAHGGRWVIWGKDAWSPYINTARRQQVMAALDWVSHETMPAILDTPSQVIIIPRCDAAGHLASLLLLNCSLDPTPPLSVRIRSPRGKRITYTQPTQAPISFTPSNTLTLPSLPSWHLGALLFD